MQQLCDTNFIWRVGETARTLKEREALVGSDSESDPGLMGVGAGAYVQS